MGFKSSFQGRWGSVGSQMDGGDGPLTYNCKSLSIKNPICVCVCVFVGVSSQCPGSVGVHSVLEDNEQVIPSFPAK